MPESPGSAGVDARVGTNGEPRALEQNGGAGQRSGREGRWSTARCRLRSWWSGRSALAGPASCPLGAAEGAGVRRFSRFRSASTNAPLVGLAEASGTDERPSLPSRRRSVSGATVIRGLGFGRAPGKDLVARDWYE